MTHVNMKARKLHDAFIIKTKHTAWASLMKSTMSCCKADCTFGAPFSSHRHTEWTDLSNRTTL